MRKLIFSLALAVMLIFGATDMLRGVAAPYLQRDLHLDYLQLGYLFSSNSLGYLAGSLIAGFVMDRVGLRLIQATGILANVAGLAVIAFSGSFFTMVLGFILTGLSGGWLEIAVNGTVPAMASSNLGQTKLFNWLHGFYGIGAFTFPVLAAWLIQATHGWRSVYVMLGGVLSFGLIIVIAGNYRGIRVTRQPEDDTVPLSQLFSQPILYGLLIAIVTYVMAEVGVGTWLPTYLVQEHGFSLAKGSLFLSGFYLTFTVGRLTAHTWVHKLGSERAILLSAAFAFVFVVLTVFGHGQWLIAVIVAGSGFAVIFPTITAVASSIFANHAGKVLGLLFSASAVGSLTANSLIGWLSTAFGLRAGFSLIALFLLCVFVSTIFVIWLQRRHMAQDAEAGLGVD